LLLSKIVVDWDGRGGKQTIPALIAIRDPTEHARRRKPWVRAFTTTALRDYEEIVGNSCRVLIDALEKRQGEILDIAAWMSYFS
jgi:cytochrome P450